ncbi:MAG: AAA family ATPase [Candidatus Paceibacterota bacterium]
MVFNLESTKILRAARKEDLFKWVSWIKKISGIFSILFLALFFFSVWKTFFIDPLQIMGLLVLSFALYIGSWVNGSFFENKVKKPTLKHSAEQVLNNIDQYNIAEVLSYETARAVAIAQSKGKVSSNELFYYLIDESSDLNFVFTRATLNEKEIKRKLKENSEEVKSDSKWWSSDFEDVLKESLKIAVEQEHQRIKPEDVLLALARHNSIFQEILIDNNLKVRDIKNLVWWLDHLKQKIKSSGQFWKLENLRKKGGIGRNWSSGYTATLDKYSYDVVDEVRSSNFREIIGHDKQLEITERILDRNKINNVLLVGRPGVGRNSVIKKLAKKSYFGTSLPGVNYQRILKLDLSSLLAKLKSSEEVESTINNIFQEVAQAGNVILVIEDFHNYIGQEGQLAKVDISGLLSKYLNLPQFQIIGVCSYSGLHKNIEKNQSLLEMFNKVEVPELPEQETIRLLQRFALSLEGKYDRIITYPALRDIVKLSAKYLPEAPFPKKALDLLDEVVVYSARQSDRRAVLSKDVAKVISDKTDIPVGKMQGKEKEKLLNLEKLIHKRIVNQDLAVEEISSALRRARTQVTIKEGPIGTFLFLGPTGVGKTETSKTLASIYFGSESRMIRLDMSEFQNVEDVERLIGSSERQGQLTVPVRENPFSLILLDEIEKAHPNILNLFLQVLDEGYITDGVGRKVNFKNTMIIATSNAGADLIWKDVEENKELNLIKKDLLGKLFQEKVFSPEFINRFDEVVMFTPLTKENLMDIAQLLLSDLADNLKEEKDVHLIITEELKKKIVELGYDPQFGAREMQRVIQNKVENSLAEGLLQGNLERGDQVKVEPENFSLNIIK